MASKVTAYLSDLKEYNRRDNTLHQTEFVLLKAEREIGKSLIELSNGELEEWIKSLEVAPNTKIHYLSRIDQYFQWAIDKEYIAKNPAGDLMKRIKRNPVKRHPALDVNQVRQLILNPGDIRRITILLVAYKTGLRSFESLSLGLDDLDTDNQKISPKERKGGKTGESVFFDDETANYLKAYLLIRRPRNPHEKKLWLDSHGRPYTTTVSLAQIAKDAAKACGFEGVTLHSFRHFFTSHLNKNRCHPKVIALLRGDSNKSMVDYYTEFTEDEIKAEYLKCIPKLNLPVLKLPESK